MTAERAPRFLPLVLFVAIALTAIAPIRNYDLFWHLATGRWITEHRALPVVDPFAVASDRREWINGEWLYQAGAYALHERAGLTGLSVARGVMAALIFTLVFVFSKDLLLTAIAFAGAMQTFDFRPSSVALLFVALAVGVAAPIRPRASRREMGMGLTILYFALAVVWVNVHPSALLVPLIAAVMTRRVLPVVASAIGLLINPHGWQAIIAPVELMAYVRSGHFVNAEWLPSRFVQFPLLYAAIAGGAVLLLVKRDWWRFLLFALFAYLALRHVRNQGVFFVAFPLLVAPSMPRVRPLLAYAGAAAAIVLVAVTGDHRLGVAPERFPMQALARLRATGLTGNIYNPDQFGGAVIWSFYPDRRALTDGRNELFRTYIPKYARARTDQRAWRDLLREYRIDLAVDEYRPPLNVIDVEGRRRSMPASLAYWPRKSWALIAFDDAGMVFARRAAFPPEAVAKWELKDVLPDAEIPR